MLALLANQLHIKFNTTKHATCISSQLKSEGFGLDKLFSEKKLEIMGVPIKYVNSTRFLGVFILIGNELSWLPQIQKLTQKLNCQIGAITRIKANIPRKFHKDLYHTLFESHVILILSKRLGRS